MDFIEKLFGISPDAGSGATEIMFLLIPILLIVLICARRGLSLRKKQISSRRS